MPAARGLAGNCSDGSGFRGRIHLASSQGPTATDHLRYVKDPRAENGLRELIAEAEQRLEQLEAIRRQALMTSSATWLSILRC